MSPILAAFSRTIVETVLDMLVPLLMKGAGGDLSAARDEALAMLADYRPQTREELRLVTEIICFGLQALAALREATLPGTPNLVMLDLLKIANVLRRNEATAQRKLDALRRPPRAPSHGPVTRSRFRALAMPSEEPDAAVRAEAAAVQTTVGASMDRLEQMQRDGLLTAQSPAGGAPLTTVAGSAPVALNETATWSSPAEAPDPRIAAYLAEIEAGVPGSGPLAAVAAAIRANAQERYGSALPNA